MTVIASSIFAGPAGAVESAFEFRDLSRSSAPASVVVECSARPIVPAGERVREIWSKSMGRQVLEVFDDHGVLTWDVNGCGRFRVAKAGDHVEIDLDPDASPTHVENVLVGPVLTVAAQLRGSAMLHASAVEFRDSAIAFTAPPGYGKSTLAASMARAGHPHVSDDVLPVNLYDDHATVSCYLPRLKLREDSLVRFGQSPEEYEHILAWHGKRRVPGSVWPASQLEELPFRALYVLLPRLSGETTFHELTGATAFRAALGAMYLSEMLRGARAASAFDAAASLVAHVPVRAVTYTRNFDHLDALADAILQDVAALS